MKKLTPNIIICLGTALFLSCSPSAQKQAKDKWVRDSIRESKQYDSITDVIEQQRKMEEMNGIPANKDSLLRSLRENK